MRKHGNDFAFIVQCDAFGCHKHFDNIGRIPPNSSVDALPLPTTVNNIQRRPICLTGNGIYDSLLVNGGSYLLLRA
jgi:hypothetical protein